MRRLNDHQLLSLAYLARCGDRGLPVGKIGAYTAKALALRSLAEYHEHGRVRITERGRRRLEREPAPEAEPVA